MLIVAPIITLFKPTFSMKTHKKSRSCDLPVYIIFHIALSKLHIKYIISYLSLQILFHPITLKNNSLCSIQTVLTFSLG